MWSGVPWIDPPEGEGEGEAAVGDRRKPSEGVRRAGSELVSADGGADFLSDTETGSRISHSYCRCGTHHVNGRREGTASLPPALVVLVGPQSPLTGPKQGTLPPPLTGQPLC